MTTMRPNIVEEGQRLLHRAREENRTMALLGGVAVRLRASDVPAPLEREYKDLDFAVPKGGGRDAAALLQSSGYEPELAFNAMNGRERMLFHDLEHGRQVDVFVGAFRMCHEIPFAGRLASGEPTLPLAELLLTKLQIVELNEKDVRDTVLLIHGHEVAGGDGDGINASRIAQLCAGDWGLWRTLTRNLERCRELAPGYELPSEDLGRIEARLQTLLELARVDGEEAFDPARPLWRITLVEGVDVAPSAPGEPTGRAALVIKLHHALADGFGALQIAVHLFDADRHPAGAPESDPHMRRPVLTLPTVVSDVVEDMSDMLRRTMAGIIAGKSATSTSCGVAFGRSGLPVLADS